MATMTICATGNVPAEDCRDRLVPATIALTRTSEQAVRFLSKSGWGSEGLFGNTGGTPRHGCPTRPLGGGGAMLRRRRLLLAAMRVGRPFAALARVAATSVQRPRTIARCRRGRTGTMRSLRSVGQAGDGRRPTHPCRQRNSTDDQGDQCGRRAESRLRRTMTARARLGEDIHDLRRERGRSEFPAAECERGRWPGNEQIAREPGSSRSAENAQKSVPREPSIVVRSRAAAKAIRRQRSASGTQR